MKICIFYAIKNGLKDFRITNLNVVGGQLMKINKRNEVLSFGIEAAKWQTLAEIFMQLIPLSRDKLENGAWSFLVPAPSGEYGAERRKMYNSSSSVLRFMS